MRCYSYFHFNDRINLKTKNKVTVDLSTFSIDSVFSLYFEPNRVTFLFSFQFQDHPDAPPRLAEPVTSKAKDIVNELHIRCNCSWSRESRELAVILSKPAFKALIDSHDEIAASIENPKPIKQESPPKLFPNGMTADAIRMVGVRKKPGEPLGLTVRILSFCWYTTWVRGRA